MWLGASRCVVLLLWEEAAMVSTTYAARSRGSGPGGRLVRVQVGRSAMPPPWPRPTGGAPASTGALPGGGGAPPRGPPTIPGSGPAVEPSFGRSASSAIETLTPSRTSAAAALRVAGVIRLTVPAWSSAPHFPQLESSVIHRSTSSLVRSRGYFPPWETACRATAAQPAAVNTALRVIGCILKSSFRGFVIVIAAGM